MIYCTAMSKKYSKTLTIFNGKSKNKQLWTDQQYATEIYFVPTVI